MDLAKDFLLLIVLNQIFSNHVFIYLFIIIIISRLDLLFYFFFYYKAPLG